MLLADKCAAVEHLYSLCGQCQALEPTSEAFQLGFRMRAVFYQYVVEMGVKVIEDRRIEVVADFFVCVMCFALEV